MNKEQSQAPWSASQTSYSRPSDMKLQENYVIRNGYLYNGTTPVALVTSGIIEAVTQGFLHVDEAGEYETG